MPGQFLHLTQILAEHLDADGRADARGEHIDPVLDRHGPGIADAGDLQRLIQFCYQTIYGHAGTPFTFRFQIDDCLGHLQRGRVGCGIGPPCLAEHRLDFGKSLDDLILGLQ